MALFDEIKVEIIDIPGNDAGLMNLDGSRKLLLHSTEGGSITSAVGAYRANNSWPHATIDCTERTMARHNDWTLAARSLRNEAGGVETNRDGTIHIQLELVGFAENPADSFGGRDDLEWLGQEIIGPLCRNYNVPIASSVAWMPYPDSYGKDAPQRLSQSGWDSYSGVLGHQHVPENSHGDPGLIPINLILQAARNESEDSFMGVDFRNRAELEEFIIECNKKFFRDALDSGRTPIGAKLEDRVRHATRDFWVEVLSDSNSSVRKQLLEVMMLGVKEQLLESLNKVTNPLADKLKAVFRTVLDERS
jgi:hypothetical protein